MNVETSIEMITPEQAARLLASNHANRPLKKRKVDEYAGAMSRGEWMVNGEGLLFGQDGRLLNGQHRLHACIKSGAAFPSLVVRGIQDHAFDTIDTGIKRSMSDVLATEGEPNYGMLASAATSVYWMEATGSPAPRLVQPTHKQIKEVIERNPDLRTDVQWCSKNRWTRGMLGAKYVAFARYWFRCDDDVAAERFFDRMESGANLELGSPILLLRDRLIQSKADVTVKMDWKYKLALVFKAYKAFRDDRTLRFLRVRMRGDGAEKNIWEL